MNRVGKLNTTLSYGSRCGVGTKFYGWILKMYELLQTPITKKNV
ncbi:hypothetical protein [Leptospira interrogans]|nr:hypothetical protein [Leptospira interrogans]